MIDRVFVKRLLNPLFIAGLVVAVGSVIQLFIAAALDEAGVIEIGNGLGYGLLMVFGGGLGCLLMVAGAAQALR